jgi:hypothetical protein
MAWAPDAEPEVTARNYDPYVYQPFDSDPDDFDAFWQD